MQTKTCQNCKTDFTIESEDFVFYDKIGVNPPTFCPECRFIRRLIWRNERSLYRRKCDLCQKDMITNYNPEAQCVVYCPDCFRSDAWDAGDYAQEYDFSKPFFAQYKELVTRVPRQGLSQNMTTNSPYANYVEEAKNVFLSYSVIWGCEDIFYSRNIDNSRQVYDSCDVLYSENVYENIHCEKNYNTLYALYSKNCLDSLFLYDCVNCSHCFLSSNLRNAEYFFKNKKYTKEEYFRIVEEYKLGTRDGIARAKKEFRELLQNSVHRFARLVNTFDSTGDDLWDCKNTKNAWNTGGAENVKYVLRSPGMKDSMDLVNAAKSELFYEFINMGGSQGRLVRFSAGSFPGCSDTYYTEMCRAVKNCFGCIGLRSKSYCILNKQYTKEAYEILLPKIIQHMNDMPYVDDKGRVFSHGEFFPYDLSRFGYNETVAMEYAPITKEEALARGYPWKDRPENKNSATHTKQQIAENIKDTTEEVTSYVILCAHSENTIHASGCSDLCTQAFRVTVEEYRFYVRMNLPLPTVCPNCRYYERLTYMNPPRLVRAVCNCDKNHFHHQGKNCGVSFETSYPENKNLHVYCEKCYQQEVV